MGREVRRVPADWQHPIDGCSRSSKGYRPLFPSRDVTALQAEWDHGAARWANGLRSDFKGGWVKRDDDGESSFDKWDGARPDPADYMPDWPIAERTHWQMYETTTEGTPISPVMESPEVLARWLADNGASAFGAMTATYEAWLATCRLGFSLGAVSVNGGPLVSGDEHNAPR